MISGVSDGVIGATRSGASGSPSPAADQGEQCMAPGTGESGSHSMWGHGLADSADRPVRGYPFPRRMGQYGVRLTVGLLVDGGGLHQGLAHELPRSDFSGLASSIWALAKAAAKETMDSLDRCRATALAFVAAIGEAAGKEIKADGPGRSSPASFETKPNPVKFEHLGIRPRSTSMVVSTN